MKTLAEIRRQLAVGQFEFSRHARTRTILRNIADTEIMEASANAVSIDG